VSIRQPHAAPGLQYRVFRIQEDKTLQQPCLVHVSVHVRRLDPFFRQQLLQELHVVPRGCSKGNKARNQNLETLQNAKRMCTICMMAEAWQLQDQDSSPPGSVCALTFMPAAKIAGLPAARTCEHDGQLAGGHHLTQQVQQGGRLVVRPADGVWFNGGQGTESVGEEGV